MRTFLIACLTFFFCSYAKAQTTFEKYYDTLGCYYANCVQQTFDGGFVLCGSSYNSSTVQDAAIIKTDSIGNIVWVKIYGGPNTDGALHIIQTSDSGYIVDGIIDAVGISNSKTWLLRLNTNGDSLWTQSFSLGTGATEASRMAIGYDGGYPLTGYFQPPTGNRNAYLIKANGNGAPLWSKIFGDTVNQWGYSVQQTYDSGYVITGGKYVGTSPDVYLVRTDSLGDTLWTKTYGDTNNDQGQSVEQTPDSGFIVAGYRFNVSLGKSNVYLIRTNSTGDTLWTKMYGDNKSSGANSVQQTSDGGYILTGNIVTGSPLNANLWLLKTDAMGDTLWTKQFGDVGPDYGFFVRQTSDGGFIITGIYWQSMMYLIKTDSLGNVITGIENSADCSEKIPVVFPNPNNGKFKIKLNDIAINCRSKITGLEIYNMLGVKIYSDKSGADSDIDISDQPDGIFMLRIYAKKEIISQKFIIQK